MAENKTRFVKTTRTAFDIIETIYNSNGTSISDIAQDTGYAISTIHDHVKTLENMEYLTIEDNGYYLGLKFLDLGMEARAKFGLTEIIEPSMQKLAEETNELVWLYVEEHGCAIPISKRTGTHAIQTPSRIGKSVPMHCTAGGKALLSAMPKSRVQEIIDDRGLPKITEKTITNESKLFKNLKKIRERGYVLNDEECTPGIRAIGVPIIVNDTLIGALSVPGAKHRMTDDRFDRELPRMVMGASNEIELNLTDFSNTQLVAHNT